MIAIPRTAPLSTSEIPTVNVFRSAPVAPDGRPASSLTVRVNKESDTTGASFTSLNWIVNVAVEKLVSLEVARIVIVWLAADSKLRSEPLATVMTPVPLLIAKRPPAESSSQ